MGAEPFVGVIKNAPVRDSESELRVEVLDTVEDYGSDTATIMPSTNPNQAMLTRSLFNSDEV